MFAKLHARLGDLWWYSAMIFITCRAGDVIQAFIGLWLVPKYVGPEELGAILPLQQLCGLFSVPLSVIALVFLKYINTYATRGEYGKVKSFIRDVIFTSSFIFLFCIAVAHFTIPFFYERLRLDSGSLTVLILLAGFTGNIAALFNNALQGLKKFKILSLANLISAPIRLITMLVAMPFRALSGYVLGQATPPTATSIIAAYTIHRELRTVKIDTSWRKDIPNIIKYLIPIAIYTVFSTLFATITSTVYRQRLPEIESAAYYFISRFAEIAGYAGLSIMVILFPIASEDHEKKEEKSTTLRNSLIVSAIITVVITTIFSIEGLWRFLLDLNETWRAYIPYIHLLPWTTLTIGATSLTGIILSYEIASRRFATSYFIITTNLVITFILVSFSGWDYYYDILPDDVVNWMGKHHLKSLNRITWFNCISALLQISILLCMTFRKKQTN